MENEIEISGTQQMFIKKKGWQTNSISICFSPDNVKDIMYSDFKRHLT